MSLAKAAAGVNSSGTELQDTMQSAKRLQVDQANRLAWGDNQGQNKPDKVRGIRTKIASLAAQARACYNP